MRKVIDFFWSLFGYQPVQTCAGIRYMTAKQKETRDCFLTLLSRDDIQYTENLTEKGYGFIHWGRIPGKSIWISLNIWPYEIKFYNMRYPSHTNTPEAKISPRALPEVERWFFKKNNMTICEAAKLP